MALYDQSSFGKLLRQGRGALAVLQRLCANQIDVEPGGLAYTAMLIERGGIESDLMRRVSPDDLSLLWAVAQRGARETLLPEISGTAAYRVTPWADLRLLELTGTVLAAVERLRRHSTNLRDIASWPGFDKPRAQRLLNGLYLQAALLVSRTHPAATNDGWSDASH